MSNFDKYDIEEPWNSEDYKKIGNKINRKVRYYYFYISDIFFYQVRYKFYWLHI